MSKGLLPAVVAAFIFAGGFGVPQQQVTPKPPAPQPAASRPSSPKVTEIDETALKSLLGAGAGRARPLLVNFWATWCVPCREEFPDLVKIRAQYDESRLDFVLVSLDDPSDIDKAVPEFLAEQRATAFPSYLLRSTDESVAINLVDPSWSGELPATFLYDRSGKVVFKHKGRIKPDQLRTALESALVAEALPAPAAQAAPPDTGGFGELLAYDAQTPLDIKTVGTERQGGVLVEDITFQGVGETVSAYVVRPAEGAGPFAGVLYVHWFAPPDPTSNRTQYLDEAKALARRGTVSLLVSTFWSDPARYKARRWQTDFENSVTQAKNLRRALDVLVSRAGVDAGRIGLVGHDYGAMFGSVVAAADSRPRAYVLIAGTARFADWYLFGSSSGKPAGADLETYRRQLARIDPVAVIPAAKGAFFFQFGEADRYTPRENFISYYTAAPSPKRIATYQSDHDMSVAIIRHDRLVWLAEQLSLPAAP